MPPTRPTFFMLSMPAMPETTVQKMISVMIIEIRRMKASPSGFIAMACAGTEIAERDRDGDRKQHLHPQSS